MLSDRRSILIEKQQLSDDKALHSANLDSLVDLRSQVKSLSGSMASKDQEILRLKEVIAKQEAVLKGEENSESEQAST